MKLTPDCLNSLSNRLEFFGFVLQDHEITSSCTIELYCTTVMKNGCSEEYTIIVTKEYGFLNEIHHTDYLELYKGSGDNAQLVSQSEGTKCLFPYSNMSKYVNLE